MKLIRAIPILLICFMFSQCQKDITNIGSPDPIPVLPDPISARLQGTVLDENGVPLQGVTVHAGPQTMTTDTRGYFRFQNATLDKKSSVVTAEKTGYFKAYRTFTATSGTNQVVIKLLPKTLAGTVDATTGGNVTLTNGGKVVLPANSIMKASDNSSFTGTVNVYAAYIDPTASDINQTIPGSFMADDKNGGRVTLASFGMMAVVLESSSAEKLQIKTGSVATLTTPIPSSRVASAPATIPMWVVNEQTGIWKEEGSATKQGNVYVGDVKHFSFWNCDIPMNAIILSMTVHTTDGDPLGYSLVKIIRQNPYQVTYGYTDSLGQVSGWVPANETLIMEVLNTYCGNPFYTQNIGPFASNSNLGIITLSASSSLNVINITGRILDCANNPVANGYARIYYGYWTTFASTDANGVFSTNYTSCASGPSTIDIVGIDNTNMQQSVSNTFPVVSPLTNAGDLVACGTSSLQFVNYTLDGTNYVINDLNSRDSIFAYTSGSGTTTITTMFSANQTGGANNIYFACAQTSQVAGTYNMLTLGVNTNSQVAPLPGSTVTITNFALLPGQFYEGSFNATFNSGGTHTLSGTFKIRR